MMHTTTFRSWIFSLTLLAWGCCLIELASSFSPLRSSSTMNNRSPITTLHRFLIPSDDLERMVADDEAQKKKEEAKKKVAAAAVPVSIPAQQQQQPQLVSSTKQTTMSLSSPARWDAFDYMQHWYPMAWVCDLPVNQPTQQTLFDINYAVAVIQKQDNDNNKQNNLTVTALRDQCPHKAAALSEGRINTQSGLLQCAYHGWSFDATGTCREIPQAAASNYSNKKYSTRSCAKAVPAMIHQGLVWLWPGPVPAAGGIDSLPMPPTLPEMDNPEFVYSPAVRDFPIDYSLLLSNIMDPDHGMFAHQNVPFDLYSASAEMPVKVEEQFPVIAAGTTSSSSTGWTMTSRVPAQEKLRAVDRAKRGEQPSSLQKNDKNTKFPPNITGTTTFHAPTHVTICRRDLHDQTKFITAFWVCPTGVGRSRFLSAGLAKGAPFRVPRWITHAFLNGFLDQDTVLVASQQPPVLLAEAISVEEQRQNARPGRAKVGPRGGLFVYQSPTDRSVRLIDQFWDATLDKVPGRSDTLLAMKRAGVLEQHSSSSMMMPSTREQVLDRKVQHLQICPDSQAAVRNCQRLVRASTIVTAAWAVVVALAASSIKPEFFSLPPLGKLLRWTGWIPVVAAAVGWAAESIRKRFYYIYTEKRRNRDLAKIPVKIWSDLH